MGHWDKKCRSKKVLCVEEDDAITPAFLGNVRECAQEETFEVNITIQEFNRRIHFAIDTGADVTCISTSCIPNYFSNKIVKSDRSILGPDGKELSVRGFLDVTLSTKRYKAKAKVYVILGLKQNLLGKPEIYKFNLISKINLTQTNYTLPPDINSEYSNVFEGIGQLKKVLKFHVNEEATPFFSVSTTNSCYSTITQAKKRTGKSYETRNNSAC